jgi:Membrane-associated lipoprotein involved in thiamine biosynthesis
MRRVETVMGTTATVEIVDFGPPDRAAELADEAFAILHEVDARFSTYRADSEVSRVNAGEPVDPSPSLREVLARCTALWRQTNGYFDAYATGRLDPSGFVKGWAVQVASDRLLAAGAVNHCVDAGGDVRVRGHSSHGRPWRVGIRHPFERNAVCCVVAGTDLAVATSGVYERGHHVLDPFTGAPARGLRSVTVVGTDLGEADALATAALAMGEAGIAWLSTLEGYASAVVTDDGRFLCSQNLPLAE